jgi:hypothetical protein
MTETATTSSASDQLSSSATINAVRTALEHTRSEFAGPRSQPAPDKPSDVAVAMRLAGEAIATATRAAETELRKVRELLEQAELRAKRAEARAHLAEQRVADWEKIFCKIRDDINGQVPPQQLAA